MIDHATKRKLLGEFNTMKLIEQDAHEFYVKASTDPSVTDVNVHNCFRTITEDEKHHMERVDRIINIINNCM